MYTKIYRNEAASAIVVPGIGEIPSGEQVSITTQYPPAVILENYPGLVDATDEAPTETKTP